MGIIIDVTLDSGLTVKDTYARISTVSGSKDSMSYCLDFYIDQEKYTKGFDYLKREQFFFTPSVTIGSQNFFKQAYLKLKQSEPYKSAKDVFEDGQA
ncbi:hypothetical protein [Bacillus cereus]|uniref:Uncharacterized protein n=1 Tax=Bacillus cereus 03BB108 TaxID=451709 RepID=A0AAN0SRE8_BACCE|nr:hypothetical protein [Bacillus cereus]AJI08567.1 hypothetical protein AK40_6289 [Bacillus cereus 03BB108]EDX59450.1 conserved hypothetical protein [Bacillus cereus 03BB108]QKG99268.1 hypothetical protein FOC96_03090 [Bacillus cereus]